MQERLPLVADRVRDRLNQLSARLGGADWLDGGFSAGDLMMVSVLLRPRSSGILDEYPNLAAYVARGETRPAYKRAFDAQLAVNTANQPTGSFDWIAGGHLVPNFAVLRCPEWDRASRHETVRA